MRLQPGKGVVTTPGEGDALAVRRNDDSLGEDVGGEKLGEAGRTLNTVVDNGSAGRALEDDGARAVGMLVLLELRGRSSEGDAMGAGLAAVDVSTAVDSKLESVALTLERTVSEAVNTLAEGLGVV